MGKEGGGRGKSGEGIVIMRAHTHTSHTRHSTFLQLLLENTCQLPIALSNSSISTDLDLTRLHGELPAVSIRVPMAA